MVGTITTSAVNTSGRVGLQAVTASAISAAAPSIAPDTAMRMAVSGRASATAAICPSRSRSTRAPVHSSTVPHNTGSVRW